MPPDTAGFLLRSDGRPRLVAIVGPTATGKSALGIALALHFDGEIVSCDSTAVYRGFDIGTDKVPVAEQHGVPHHMVDIVGPTEDYRPHGMRAKPPRSCATSPVEAACPFWSEALVSTIAR